MSSAAVLVGAWWAAARLPVEVWPAALAGALLAAFANADNDARDALLDGRAHPARPIPSGALTVTEARRAAAIWAGAGIAAATVARPALGVASAAVVAAMQAYNRVGVRYAAVKNATVALLASLPFVYGALVAGSLSAGVALAAVGVPLHFARELAKDLDDAAADAATRRTIPLAAGVRVSVAIVWLAVVAFAIAAARLREWPLSALLAPAVALAMWGAERAARRVSGAPALFKAAMLAAMAAAVTLRAI